MSKMMRTYSDMNIHTSNCGGHYVLLAITKLAHRSMTGVPARNWSMMKLLRWMRSFYCASIKTFGDDRRVNLEAAFTSNSLLPNPLATFKHWHWLGTRETISKAIDHYELPNAPITIGFRKMRHESYRDTVGFATTYTDIIMNSSYNKVFASEHYKQNRVIKAISLFPYPLCGLNYEGIKNATEPTLTQETRLITSLQSPASMTIAINEDRVSSQRKTRSLSFSEELSMSYVSVLSRLNEVKSSAAHSDSLTNSFSACIQQFLPSAGLKGDLKEEEYLTMKLEYRIDKNRIRININTTYKNKNITLLQYLFVVGVSHQPTKPFGDEILRYHHGPR
ncbi:hypothetical protein V2J09_012599 [Rumex salicifolius]